MNEKQYVVLSAMGTDRPGLVAEISGFLTECGCNLEDSRMAALGGEFGVMILFSGSPEQVERVFQRERQLEAEANLRITLKRTRSPGEHRGPGAVSYEVCAEGLDHEGLVHTLTEALHELGANIVSLTTTTYNAPVTGTPLFQLVALVDVPGETTAGKLRARLAPLAEAANLDLDVRLAKNILPA